MSVEHIGEERMQEVLDHKGGALTGEERAHLEGCPFCQEQMAAWRGFYPLMASLPMPRLPEDFSLQVLERLEREGVPEQPLFARRLWLMVAALWVGVLGVLQAVYGWMDGLIGGGRGLWESIGRLAGSVHTLTAYLPAGGGGVWLGVLFCFGAIALLDRGLQRHFKSHP